jgi:hypothetical protein
MVSSLIAIVFHRIFIGRFTISYSAVQITSRVPSSRIACLSSLRYLLINKVLTLQLWDCCSWQLQRAELIIERAAAVAVWRTDMNRMFMLCSVKCDVV